MTNFFKDNQDAFIGGVVAVLFGFFTKIMVKKEILPVSNTPKIFLTFLTVSTAAIGGKEINKRI